MIEFESVTKRYGEKTAVQSLSLTIENGSVCVLIGPSGCGKSTTLKMINRLLAPSEGEIRVDGEPIDRRPAEELRRRMGYVIQSVGLLPHMSVADNIGLVPRLLGWGKTRRDKRADELLSLVGLAPEEYREKLPRQLSGGEAQRVGVARALAADPPYLLMDEPFGAVDPLNRATLQQVFRSIQRRLKKTVVMVTHDLDEAILLGDTVAVIDNGVLHQHARPAELLGKPATQFVSDFVGSDRIFRRLATIDLDTVAAQLPQAGVNDQLPQLETSDGRTLRDALVLFLESGNNHIGVTDKSGNVRQMDFATVQSLAVGDVVKAAV